MLVDSVGLWCIYHTMRGICLYLSYPYGKSSIRMQMQAGIYSSMDIAGGEDIAGTEACKRDAKKRGMDPGGAISAVESNGQVSWRDEQVRLLVILGFVEACVAHCLGGAEKKIVSLHWTAGLCRRICFLVLPIFTLLAYSRWEKIAKMLKSVIETTIASIPFLFFSSAHGRFFRTNCTRLRITISFAHVSKNLIRKSASSGL